MRVREYGTSGRRVVILHGGPGAPGSMAPVARGLAGSFRVLEPFQRGSGGGSLTVAGHIADLHALVSTRCHGEPPALVGHSWGAMLALAYAAAHPGSADALVLVGCGTFDPVARDHMRKVCEARMLPALRERIEHISEEFPDPDARLRAMGDLMLPLYSHDLASTDLEVEHCDARAYQETWADMLRLQEEGIYPDSFMSIQSPVLMLHGAADPHPGGMIRRALGRRLPHLEYREWERCGHYPWLERGAQDEFFVVLREWLSTRRAGETR